MKSILIVCTANICRSPMAEGLLKMIAKTQPPGANWIVESAGTWGQEGLPAAEHATAIMQKYSLDLSNHRSRIVNSPIIKKSDLILTMEANQKEALQIEFPEERKKIFLLSELIGEIYDIEDPMGQPPDAFERTAREIEEILSRGFKRIVELLGEETPSHGPTLNK